MSRRGPWAVSPEYACSGNLDRPACCGWASSFPISGEHVPSYHVIPAGADLVHHAVDTGAEQLLQPLAVVCFDPHRGVQAEAVAVGAQGLARRVLAWHCASQGMNLLPGARAEGDAVSDGCGLQRPQGMRLVPVGIRLGQVDLAHAFDQHAAAGE